MNKKLVYHYDFDISFKDFWNKSSIPIYIDIFKNSPDYYLRENLLYLDKEVSKEVSKEEATIILLTIWLLDNRSMNYFGLLEDFYTLYKTKDKYDKYGVYIGEKNKLHIYAKTYNILRITNGGYGLVYM